jgi:hypothetical protein
MGPLISTFLSLAAKRCIQLRSRYSRKSNGKLTAMDFLGIKSGLLLVVRSGSEWNQE